jgi:hypothetical protein
MSWEPVDLSKVDLNKPFEPPQSDCLTCGAVAGEWCRRLDSGEPIVDGYSHGPRNARARFVEGPSE